MNIGYTMLNICRNYMPLAHTKINNINDLIDLPVFSYFEYQFCIKLHCLFYLCGVSNTYFLAHTAGVLTTTSLPDAHPPRELSLVEQRSPYGKEGRDVNPLQVAQSTSVFFHRIKQNSTEKSLQNSAVHSETFPFGIFINI